MGNGHYDIAIIGGGLAGGLCAARLHEARSDLRWILVERAETLGRKHTWSFHTSDTDASWIESLVSAQWPTQEVCFPGTFRLFRQGYATIRSQNFDRVLQERLGPHLRLGTTVDSLKNGSLRLSTGESLTAELIIDARGGYEGPVLGYQKFRGLVIETAEPHGFPRPVIMDARVEQTDGYRFVYVLPFSPTTALVEDTYYSDSPHLPDEAVVQQEIATYLSRHGLGTYEVRDQESGVLPLPPHGAAPPEPPPGVVWAGVKGGLFHPTTGYSFAEAVRFAERFVESLTASPHTATDELRRYARSVWENHSFFRRLNNMLFLAAPPHERRRIFSQFYGRGEGLITRFYRGRLGFGDRARLLSGRPPVPVGRGLRAFFNEWQTASTPAAVETKA